MFIKNNQPTYSTAVIHQGEFAQQITTKYIKDISSVSNTPLQVNKTTTAPFKNSRHTPLKGIRKWFASRVSFLCKTNPHRIAREKTGYWSNGYINKADAHTLEQHADWLIELVPEHGDALILSFGRALHSAMLLNNNGTMKYFSLYGDGAWEGTGKDTCRKYIAEDMDTFNDTLFTRGGNNNSPCQISSTGKDNFQKIKIKNVDGAIQAWERNCTQYHTFKHNCSFIIKEMIKHGLDENKTFKYDRRWQMPYNTLCLAREVAMQQQVTRPAGFPANNAVAEVTSEKKRCHGLPIKEHRGSK